MSFKKFLPGLALGLIFVVAFALGLSGMGTTTTTAKPAPGPAVTIPSGNATALDLVAATPGTNLSVTNPNDTGNTDLAPAPQYNQNHEGNEQHGGKNEGHEHEGDDD